jgi:hypothetical protein
LPEIVHGSALTSEPKPGGLQLSRHPKARGPEPQGLDAGGNSKRTLTHPVIET